MSRADRKRRRDAEDESPAGLRVRVQEQLLIDSLGDFPSGRLLCNTAGRGQLPRAYAAAHPGSHATCWFLDLYQRNMAEQEDPGLRAEGFETAAERSCVAEVPFRASSLSAESAWGEAGGDLRSEKWWHGQETAPQQQPQQQQETAPQRDQVCHSALSPQPSAVTYACTADPPGENYDVVAWCTSARGDGELTRETLQAGHERLRMNGRFIAAIDNPNDQWLHDELHKLFPKVTRRPTDDGVVYLATKTARLPKHKSYDAEFAFRDQGKLIYACSRPGVFSHRHIDPGARALINTMQIAPRNRVLDLGCGTGVAGLAALCRADRVRVLAVDSNPRALQCAERGARRNDLSGLETVLDCTGEGVPPNEFDVVLANPPYFSHYRIADLFLQTAQRSLRRGGVVHVVTKTPDWFAEQMPLYFHHVDPQPVKSYWVVTGKGARK